MNTLSEATLKRLRKTYDEYEDRNEHLSNYLLLATFFGTDEDKEEVKKIKARRDRRGYLTQKESTWLYENINPYYDHLRNVKAAETFNADIDTEMKDFWNDNVKHSWEQWGFERYQNDRLNRSMKSCVKDWLADNPNKLAYMVQDNHEINEESMDGDYEVPSPQMMKKEVAYLKSVLLKVADEMDKNGEWHQHSHKVNFDAETFDAEKSGYGMICNCGNTSGWIVRSFTGQDQPPEGFFNTVYHIECPSCREYVITYQRNDSPKSPFKKNAETFNAQYDFDKSFDPKGDEHKCWYDDHQWVCYDIDARNDNSTFDITLMCEECGMKVDVSGAVGNLTKKGKGAETFEAPRKKTDFSDLPIQYKTNRMNSAICISKPDNSGDSLCGKAQFAMYCGTSVGNEISCAKCKSLFTKMTDEEKEKVRAYGDSPQNYNGAETFESETFASDWWSMWRGNFQNSYDQAEAIDAIGECVRADGRGDMRLHEAMKAIQTIVNRTYGIGEPVGGEDVRFEEFGAWDANCSVCNGTGWMPKKGDPKDAEIAKLFGLSIDELTMQPCNAGGKDMGCFGAESFSADNIITCEECGTTKGVKTYNSGYVGIMWTHCDKCRYGVVHDRKEREKESSYNYLMDLREEMNEEDYDAESIFPDDKVSLRVWAKDMEKDHLGYFVSKNKDGWETWRGLCGITSDKGVSRGFNVSNYDGSYGRRCRKCLTAYKKMGEELNASYGAETFGKNAKGEYFRHFQSESKKTKYGMIAAGVITAFALFPEIKKRF